MFMVCIVVVWGALKPELHPEADSPCQFCLALLGLSACSCGQTVNPFLYLQF